MWIVTEKVKLFALFKILKYCHTLNISKWVKIFRGSGPRDTLASGEYTWYREYFYIITLQQVAFKTIAGSEFNGAFWVLLNGRDFLTRLKKFAKINKSTQNYLAALQYFVHGNLFVMMI